MKLVTFQPWHDRPQPADDMPLPVTITRCVGGEWVERLVPVKRTDGVTVGKVVRIYRAFSNTPKFNRRETK